MWQFSPATEILMDQFDPACKKYNTTINPSIGADLLLGITTFKKEPSIKTETVED